MTARRHILLRCLIALAIVWQAAWPSVAQTRGAFNAAGYMCSPSSETPSKASQQLAEILRIAGKIPEESSNEHCALCFISPIGIDETSHIIGNQKSFPSPSPAYYANIHHPNYFAQGPPLGGRAPPYFA